MLSPSELLDRWFQEIWNEQRAETIDELLHEDGVIHGLPGGPVTGPREFREFHRGLLEVFGSFDMRVIAIAEYGDEAMVRFEYIATHRGTGHRTALECAAWLRCRDGKVLEGHNYIDFLALLQQVGCAPGTYFQEQVAGRNRPG